MGGEASVTRTADGLDHGNTLVFPTVKVRFQIAPGTAAGLGIEGAPFTIVIGGVESGTGTTTADGEVELPVLPIQDGTLVLRIFETEYAFTMHPGLTDIDHLRGQQKRLDVLGYMTGYLRDAIGSDDPDDGSDGTRTQQSIVNFQADSRLQIDGDVGARTVDALRTAMNE